MFIKSIFIFISSICHFHIQISAVTSQSHAVSTWPPPGTQEAVTSADRPHTISTAYERGHQRPALTVYTFQNPETISESTSQKSPAASLSCRPPLPIVGISLFVFTSFLCLISLMLLFFMFSQFTFFPFGYLFYHSHFSADDVECFSCVHHVISNDNKKKNYAEQNVYFHFLLVWFLFHFAALLVLRAATISDIKFS